MISIVSKTTNKQGLVTVALTNGHVTVQCADMLFFDDEDLGSTFCEWEELAQLGLAADDILSCGCSFVK